MHSVYCHVFYSLLISTEQRKEQIQALWWSVGVVTVFRIIAQPTLLPAWQKGRRDVLTVWTCPLWNLGQFFSNLCSCWWQALSLQSAVTSKQQHSFRLLTQSCVLIDT